MYVITRSETKKVFDASTNSPPLNFLSAVEKILQASGGYHSLLKACILRVYLD